ncbi:DUF6443 domain-containing protein [Reichenbachiella sp. MALMAid0571]|uniref:DUF6443 domain-containing protein n=1 Tax=Reichenbachiella sp. MALMAid0571 TaxID=3143939 RepID=UPI0032DFC6CB
MMIQIPQKNAYAVSKVLRLFFLCFALLVFASYSDAQNVTIYGPTSVSQNDIDYYYVDIYESLIYSGWYVYTGQIQSEYEKNVTVKWTNSGTQYMYYDADGYYDYYYGDLAVSVASAGPTAPGDPTITTSGVCSSNNQATLTRSGSPPSGVTWFWQGKSSAGTSTSKGSGSTFTANEGTGWYYIRARNSSNQWSSSSGKVYVTITSAPQTYGAYVNVANQNCGGGAATLSLNYPPDFANGTVFKLYKTGQSSYLQQVTKTSDSQYSLSFNYTANPGTYTATATTGSCTVTLDNSAVVSAAPPPPSNPTISVDINSSEESPGSYCPGNVTLLSNVSGDWYKDGVDTGTDGYSYVPTATGSHTYKVRKITTSCGTTYTKYSSDLAITVIPAVGQVSISGGVSSRCRGGGTTDYNANASNASTYSWSISPSSAGSINSSGLVTWLSSFSGSATISVTASVCGTSTSANKTVTVTPYVTTTAITGTSSLCRNSADTDYNASVSNGTGTWSITSGAGTINSSGLVNWDSNFSGTAVITYTGTGCGSNSVQTKNVTVTPYVTTTAITGTSSLCRNSADTDYNASVSNGTGTWSITSGAGTINSSGLVNWDSNFSGTAVITYTGTGCGSNSVQTKNVTINDFPTVSAGSDLQVFTTNTFTITGGSPSGGTWSGTGVTGGNTFNAATAGTGTHTITYSYTDGNTCSNTDTRNITVVSNPVVALTGQTELAIGESSTLTATSGYAAYQWKKNDQNIAGATVNSYSVTTAGSYKVAITNADNFIWTSPATEITRVLADEDENYIMTWTFKEEGMDPDNIPEDVSKVNRKVDYFDGLGRPVQTVLWQASPGPDPHDIIQPILYDEFGRQTKSFLPYVATTSGGIVAANAASLDETAHASTSQYDFYHTAGKVAHDDYPFSETIYEASPLNRVLKQGAPGAAWQPDEDVEVTTDRVVRFSYEANTTTGANSCTTGCDDVIVWTINSSDEPVANTPYGAGQLYKNITEDEEFHQVVEFTDKQGRTILKKVETGDGANPWAQTYYIYDDFGNLRFVLPPMVFSGNATLDAGELDNYAFQYKYDARQRMVEKKVPGAGWVYMVYDKRDRLVLTQDANQRPDSLWTFTKYDVLNRPVLTGIYTHTATITQDSMQAVVNTLAGGTSAWYESRQTTTGNVHGYNNASFPDVSDTSAYLTVTYYDNYDYQNDQETTWGTGYDYSNPSLSHDSYTSETSENTAVKGQVTGGKVKNLATGQWLKSATYYDNRYRVIQAKGDNNLGGIDVTSNLYDFTGKVLQTKTVHDDGSDTTPILRTFDYDHADRLLAVKHKTDTEDEITLLKNEYNQIGELVDKSLHSTDGTDFMQSVDYRYNIRGWLTSMNNSGLTDDSGLTNDDDNTSLQDFFGFELAYNNTMTGTSNTQAYNGNISAMKWSDFQSVGGVSERAYSYSYDAMNRLTFAQHHSDITGSLGNVSEYKVSGISYDLNGNILSLSRLGKNAEGFDDLTYNYGLPGATSNRLKKVDDDIVNESYGFKDAVEVAEEYLYDANGNMVKDLNKGIDSIYYNHLNLPYIVDMDNPGDSIVYEYDASGIKLKQRVYQADTLFKTTDYAGEFIYENGVLQFIRHEEGRIIQEPNDSFTYQYHLKDHLGNTRSTFTSGVYTSIYTATMESDLQATADQEESEFYNISETRHTYANANHTVGGNESALVNSANPIGPAFYTHVERGDIVNFIAYAYYENTSGWSNSYDPAVLAANIANVFGTSGAAGEAGQVFTGINDAISNNASVLIGGNSSDTNPSAYINYLMLDDNYDYIVGSGGYVGVTTAALNANEPIFNDMALEVEQSGYLYIYISNESNSLNPVYFDDFNVSIQESPVLETTDYYPFGLTFNSYAKPGTIGQNFKYNSKELVADLSLGWYDYQARWYDPALGRWHTVDPAADFMRRHSPYNYAFDNPIRFIDPDGMVPTGGGEKLLNAAVKDNVVNSISKANNSARNVISIKGGLQGAGIGGKVKLGSSFKLNVEGKAFSVEGSASTNGDKSISGSVTSTEFGFTLGNAVDISYSQDDIKTEIKSDDEGITGGTKLRDKKGNAKIGNTKLSSSGGEGANEFSVGATFGQVSGEISANLDALSNFVDESIDAIGNFFGNVVDSIIKPGSNVETED